MIHPPKVPLAYVKEVPMRDPPPELPPHLLLLASTWSTKNTQRTTRVYLSSTQKKRQPALFQAQRYWNKPVVIRPAPYILPNPMTARWKPLTDHIWLEPHQTKSKSPKLPHVPYSVDSNLPLWHQFALPGYRPRSFPWTEPNSTKFDLHILES